jgi:hypothetical protein
MFGRSFSRVGRALRVAPRPAAKVQAKRMSGHGHGQAHAKGPYEAHHEPSIYGNTPLPFGIGPNYVMEGWEVPVVGTFIIVFGMLFYSEVFQDNETPMVRIK